MIALALLASSAARAVAWTEAGNATRRLAAKAECVDDDAFKASRPARRSAPSSGAGLRATPRRRRVLERSVEISAKFKNRIVRGRGSNRRRGRESDSVRAQVHRLPGLHVRAPEKEIAAAAVGALQHQHRRSG